MAWTPLSTRFGSIPIVLAGPILRKVTPTSVTVWLALKQSADVTLSVMPTDAPNATALFSSTPASTVEVGPHLHIVAVTARASASAPLKPGVVYFYTLAFTTNGQSLTMTAALGTDTTIFAYPTLNLPSFMLAPADINQVRLIQGSCRKPNAMGPDALATLDTLIGASITDKTVVRPHQLILGGDQIYADEVADVLLLMLSDASMFLLGQGENMPLTNGAVLAENVLPTTRTALIVNIAKFTSEDTRSHLMSLGEYLAMYLFVWSPVLWPGVDDIPVLDDLVNAGVKRTSLADDIIVEVGTQRDAVKVFAATLKAVRRALANVPTYMILDDHEVTDDYNMTQEFCENVYGNPLGVRIIRNALAAYALCQHWGNAPEQFEPNKALTSGAPAGVAFLQSFATAGTDPGKFDTTLKQVLGVHTPDQMAAQKPCFAAFHDTGQRVQTTDGWLDDTSLLFHYSIEGLAYQLIVTDSRTWRSFPRTPKVSPPDLIAASQLAVQIGGTPDLAGRFLLVLFTTNFPPSPGIRQAVRDLPQFKGQIYAHDLYDSWEIERVDYGRALAALSRKFPKDANGVLRGSLALLSGDVHSSSTSRLHYGATAQTGDASTAATKADLVVAQLVASAFHNQSEPTVGEHKQGYRYVPDKLAAKFAQEVVQLTEDFIGWNPITTASGTRVTDREESHLSLTDQTKSHVQTVPWTVDDDRTIATLRIESQVQIDTMEVLVGQIVNVVKPPDFQMHLEYLKADPAGNSGYKPPPIDKTSAMTTARDRSAAHQSYASKVRAGNEIVGLNNIGEIRFTFDPKATPAKQVHSIIRWFDSGTNQQATFHVTLDSTSDFAKYPGEK